MFKIPQQNYVLLKNVIESIVGIFYGVPASKARERRAIANIKETEALEKLWELLGKMGYSKKQRKYFFAKTNTQLKKTIIQATEQKNTMDEEEWQG